MNSMLSSMICPKLDEFATLKEMPFSLKKDAVTASLLWILTSTRGALPSKRGALPRLPRGRPEAGARGAA